MLSCKSSQENPALEGTYDTFNNDADGDSLENDVQDSEQASSTQDDDDTNDDDEAFAQEISHSLPSAILRKGLSSTGSVRYKELSDANNGRLDVTDLALEDFDIQEDNLEVFNKGFKVETLRNMTTTLDSKKSARLRVQNPRKVNAWQQFKYGNALRWLKFTNFMNDSFHMIDVWKEHLKQVEGLFGTGVLSYFTFLRWLLYFNLIVCLLTVAFLFVPQILYDQSSKHNAEGFSGIELLTGEGWFTYSELYYGQYTNALIHNRYRMKYAYLLVGGGSILICVVILAASMAESYKRNYIVGGEGFTPFISKIFCSWDYAITNINTAKIKQQSIAQDIIETLGSGKSKREESSCGLVLWRMVTNIIALALMAGSTYLIVYVSEISVEIRNDSKIAVSNTKALLPAITISALNLIMPSAFRLIASIEHYNSAKNELRITLIRTIVLKLASIIVYVVALHRELTLKSAAIKTICWETFVGQVFYKLVIIDFITILISIFIGEFIRSLLSKYISSIGKPGFDISRNVLDLIYGQGICWLGTFYCPLLPIINVLKLIIIFYLRKESLIRNCRSSLRPFKASKMNVIFLALLSLMLILSMIVIGYVIMNGEGLKPSQVCGPFRGQKSIYATVGDIIGELPDVLIRVVNVVSSLTVIAVILFFTGLLAYYFRIRKKSSEKRIKLMQHQLSLAGQDKQYLIAKLRRILKRKQH